MSARIHVNLEPRPVIDGRWHLVAAPLRTIPQTGEPITTLCGLTENVEYGANDDTWGAVQQCWNCDEAWRRQENELNSPEHSRSAPARPRRY